VSGNPTPEERDLEFTSALDALAAAHRLLEAPCSEADAQRAANKLRIAAAKFEWIDLWFADLPEKWHEDIASEAECVDGCFGLFAHDPDQLARELKVVRKRVVKIRGRIRASLS
jgi:hypothetical protein